MSDGKNDGVASADGSRALGNDGSDYGSANDSGNAGASEIAGLPVASPIVGSDGGSSDGGTGKRGRGRPRKSDTGSASGTASTGKPANAGKAAPQKAKANVSGIEKILFSLHLGVAKFTKIEELALDREESKVLAEAVAEVSSHYNVEINPKTAAWLGLVTAFGTIYGPRVAAFGVRKKMERAMSNDGEITGDVKPADMGNTGKVVQMTNIGFPTIPATAH